MHVYMYICMNACMYAYMGVRVIVFNSTRHMRHLSSHKAYIDTNKNIIISYIIIIIIIMIKNIIIMIIIFIIIVIIIIICICMSLVAL